MEPFDVRVRRWVEQAHELLSRVATDPRCPEEIRRKTLEPVLETATRFHTLVAGPEQLPLVPTEEAGDAV